MFLGYIIKFLRGGGGAEGAWCGGEEEIAVGDWDRIEYDGYVMSLKITERIQLRYRYLPLVTAKFDENR